MFRSVCNVSLYTFLISKILLTWKGDRRGVSREAVIGPHIFYLVSYIMLLSISKNSRPVYGPYYDLQYV